MKANELLTKIFPATAFPDNDLAAALGASGLKDVELPDEILAKFNAYYMTPDRAKNDPEIAKAYKSKNWGYFADEMERAYKSIISILPDAFQTEYYAIPTDKVNGIYDRLEVLKKGVSHLAEKGAGDDVKTAAEKFRKTEKELREQITTAEKKAKDLETEYQSKESGIKINYALRSMITNMIPKLDPAVVKTQKQKDFIIDSTIHSLQSGYLLEFDKDNPTSINFLNKDRTGVFEGNTPVTLDKFIEKELEPYVVKNNGGATADKAAPDPKKIQPPTGANDGTLKAYRIQQAQKAGVLG